MAATAAATVSPPQMVLRFEYHQAFLIKVEFAGLNWLPPVSFALAPERSYAILADARSIHHFRRHLRQQLMRNLDLRAPAQAFVPSGGAKLTAVRLPA